RARSGRLADLVLPGRNGHRPEALAAGHVGLRLIVDGEIEAASVVGRIADLDHGQLGGPGLRALVDGYDPAPGVIARLERHRPVGKAVAADEAVVIAQVGAVRSSFADDVRAGAHFHGARRPVTAEHDPVNAVAVDREDPDPELAVAPHRETDLSHG